MMHFICWCSVRIVIDCNTTAQMFIISLYGEMYAIKHDIVSGPNCANLLDYQRGLWTVPQMSIIIIYNSTWSILIQ